MCNCMRRLTFMYDAMSQSPIIVSQPNARGMYVFAEVCRSCRILVLVKKKKKIQTKILNSQEERELCAVV